MKYLYGFKSCMSNNEENTSVIKSLGPSGVEGLLPSLQRYLESYRYNVGLTT